MDNSSPTQCTNTFQLPVPTSEFFFRVLQLHYLEIIFTTYIPQESYISGDSVISNNKNIGFKN